MAAKNQDRDHWHVFANRLFLDYVRGRLGATPRAWGDFPPSPWHRTRSTYPQEHSTTLAVQRKNQFADSMAELPELPDAADIRDRWTRAMELAEADIRAYLATDPAAGQLALS